MVDLVGGRIRGRVGMGAFVGRGIVGCGVAGDSGSGGKGTWIVWSLAVQSNGT